MDALLHRIHMAGHAKSPSAWSILALWRTKKFDTLDIAKKLVVEEHVIANRLPHLLEMDGGAR